MDFQDFVPSFKHIFSLMNVIGGCFASLFQIVIWCFALQYLYNSDSCINRNLMNQIVSPTITILFALIVVSLGVYILSKIFGSDISFKYLGWVFNGITTGVFILLAVLMILPINFTSCLAFLIVAIIFIIAPCKLWLDTIINEVNYIKDCWRSH